MTKIDPFFRIFLNQVKENYLIMGNLFELIIRFIVHFRSFLECFLCLY